MKKTLSGQNLKEGEYKEERFDAVEKAYGQFLSALGYDWKSDPNMNETPKRVAKMYLREITQGTYDEAPNITVFPNKGKYKGMVLQMDIDVKSLCSHHMMPFVGKCHIAYIPGLDENSRVIGLSKLNRIVAFFARRPQLQEQLTTQIREYLQELMPDNRGIAVYIEASHTCVSLRGVNEQSTMKTVDISGAFEENVDTRAEFYSLINK